MKSEIKRKTSKAIELNDKFDKIKLSRENNEYYYLIDIDE